MTPVHPPTEDLNVGRRLVLVRQPEGAAGSASDEALVLGYAAGEPEAAECIWQKYAPLVDRTLQRFLGPGREIEDLTQEVCLRLFLKLHTLKDCSALRSFVYSIAIRVARWEARRRWVRRCVMLSSRGSVPEQAIAGDDFEARQAATRFFVILDKLGGSTRAAFVLRHLEGLSFPEVAKRMGRTLSSVDKLWVRALARLRRVLGVVS